MSEKFQVANTIIQQMGGQGRLKAMVNGRNWAADEKMVQFSFSGSRKVNKCQVELDYASDTYIFRLFKYSPSKYTSTLVYELEGVYCDMLIELFESQTGLYLRL